MKDSLHERGKAIENSFFAHSDHVLLDKIRAEMAAQSSREALQAASGISDESVLDALANSGITPESLASVALVPLVAVAWADKVMEESEKSAILQAADISGVKLGTASYAAMEIWLTQQPKPELMETWAAYVGAMKSILDESAFSQLKTSVIGRAESVAESAGGFLGLAYKISDAERKVLNGLAEAFD